MEELSKKQIIEYIEELSDKFYQNKVQEGVCQLPKLIQILTNIASRLNIENQNEYLNLLKNVLEAMEEKEYIMLADILVFDVAKAIQRYQF